MKNDISIATLRLRNAFEKRIAHLEEELRNSKQEYADANINEKLDATIKCCTNCGAKPSEAINLKQKYINIFSISEPKSSDYSDIADLPNMVYRGKWLVTQTRISCKNCGEKWQL